MGVLTGYLQRAFADICPPGWICRREVPLLGPEFADVLGYTPRADVLLERPDGRRLWVEFEISRADPVANHAKFATAHLFAPQPEHDTFVAMVSPHVVAGRRNLAANTIALMRRVGMSAFQTVLLPHLSGAEVKRLNHLDSALLTREALTPDVELERALAITEPVLMTGEQSLHFAGDILDVLLNLRRWHLDLASEAGWAAWGRRTITYFVVDERTERFAPAKFCAYTVIPPRGSTISAEMTVPLYAVLDKNAKSFDGYKARQHLMQRLAFVELHMAQRPALGAMFQAWLGRHQNVVRVHPGGAIFLLPPAWWRKDLV